MVGFGWFCGWYKEVVVHGQKRFSQLMNGKFEILNNFKGFGNPTGNYWFIGIEEALEIGTDDLQTRLDLYQNEVISSAPGQLSEDAKTHGRRFTKIYNIMSKIIVGTDSTWKKYRDEKLLQRTSNEFQMNLFPLGKNKVSAWPTHYNDLFSIESSDNYYKIVKEIRFKKLREFWEQYKPKITICFGVSFKDDFKTLLSLFDKQEIKCEDYRISYFPTSRVIITPFFDNRQLNSKGIEKIREIINQAA
jgi:hypothetical protein